MDYITNLYGMILNLIRTIIGLFDGPTEYIDGLIAEFEASQKEDEEATV